MISDLKNIFPALRGQEGDAADILSAAIALYIVSIEDDEQREQIIKGISNSIDMIAGILKENDAVNVTRISPTKNYIIDIGFTTNLDIAEESISKKIEELRNMALNSSIDEETDYDGEGQQLPEDPTMMEGSIQEIQDDDGFGMVEGATMDDLGIVEETSFGTDEEGIIPDEISRAEQRIAEEETDNSMFSVFAGDDDYEEHPQTNDVENGDMFIGDEDVLGMISSAEGENDNESSDTTSDSEETGGDDQEDGTEGFYEIEDMDTDWEETTDTVINKIIIKYEEEQQGQNEEK